ncbi:MAG TPA: CapA family protein [Candidatus Bilamarchaeum sp.]|nr:CapA family protein [Candidatus Bilamarchaeum sp.]
MVRLAFLGDLMLGRNLNYAAMENGPAYPWGNTLPVLKSADLRLANLECVISDKGVPWAPGEKAFHFRAEPLAIPVLKAAEIGFVSLANNHSLDFSKDALFDMLSRLDEAGIRHAGAGADFSEAAAPAILEAGSLKVGVISATDNTPEWEAKPGSPGVFFLPTLPRPEVLEKIGKSARLAREKGAETIVFSDHWGPNMRQRPGPLHESFASSVLDIGIDIFHGHSAHIFQGVGMHGGKPVLFDTGDFVDDYAVDPHLRNDWSFIFLLDLGAKTGRLQKVTLVPAHISGCQANLAPEPLAGIICQKMESLCLEMGTEARKEGRNLVIEPA